MPSGPIDDISVGSPTGVQDIAGDLKMELYPNPTREHVTVSGLPPRTVVRITDISGKLLLETATGTGNTTELNLGALTPGIYLLHTSFGTRKLVKL
ncbi:MAG: T9SS type A sorting domain-containing protein [Taibaiella sp.]|nr:T9SS type A sorting domain-containing protein [Taibaiella sp.]